MHAVLIVEDQTIASAGVKFTLETNASLLLLPEVNSCKKARSALADSDPDIVILDVFLPDGTGLDLLEEIKALNQEKPKVLIYSGQANPQEFSIALKLGADGLLSKSDPPEELKTALDKLINGETYISLSVQRLLSLSTSTGLTAREQQVLQLLFQGLTNDDIADRLNISEGTIRKHRENILHKLDVPNMVAAARAGVRLGIIDVNSR